MKQEGVSQDARNAVGSNDGITNVIAGQDYFSMSEIALRWRCSRGTVYNRLRSGGARVLDFAQPGKRGKKVVSAAVVLEIERRQAKRLK